MNSEAKISLDQLVLRHPVVPGLTGASAIADSFRLDMIELITQQPTIILLNWSKIANWVVEHPDETADPRKMKLDRRVLLAPDAKWEGSFDYDDPGLPIQRFPQSHHLSDQPHTFSTIPNVLGAIHSGPLHDGLLSTLAEFSIHLLRAMPTADKK